MLPTDKYIVWFSKVDPPWYVRDLEGKVHGCHLVTFTDGVTLFDELGYSDLPRGPKAVIAASGAEWK